MNGRWPECVPTHGVHSGGIEHRDRTQIVDDPKSDAPPCVAHVGHVARPPKRTRGGCHVWTVSRFTTLSTPKTYQASFSASARSASRGTVPSR